MGPDANNAGYFASKIPFGGIKEDVHSAFGYSTHREISEWERAPRLSLHIDPAIKSIKISNPHSHTLCLLKPDETVWNLKFEPRCSDLECLHPRLIGFEEWTHIRTYREYTDGTPFGTLNQLVDCPLRP